MFLYDQLRVWLGMSTRRSQVHVCNSLDSMTESNFVWPSSASSDSVNDANTKKLIPEGKEMFKMTAKSKEIIKMAVMSVQMIETAVENLEMNKTVTESV